MTLATQLLELQQAALSGMPEPAKSILIQAIDDMEKQGVGSDALKAGDRFPDFYLSNATGASRNLEQLLEDYEFLVVSYYRGDWCPYCNLELRALQGIQEQLAAASARLVAITPEVPDQSLTTVEKFELSFEVLSDLKLTLAEQLNIVFQLPDYLIPIYDQFKIDLQTLNHDERRVLPIPATFIINKDQQIIFSYTESDYSKRLEPAVILQEIAKA